MPTKATTKRPTARATKKVVSKKASVATSTSKRSTTTKKPTQAKRKVSAVDVSNKVDYYPNRMTVAISALAGTILVLVAVIAVLGSRG